MRSSQARRRCRSAAPRLARARPGAGGGQLTGIVSGADGKPLGGVTVVVAEAALAEITDGNGLYHLTGIPPGSYTVTFSLGDRVATAAGVEVKPGQVTHLDHQVDWDVSYAETITVYSASRRRERVVEAPAAITVVSEEEIGREASHGQLAKVLEFTPGAEVTQSGLYDFNLNTRGFNSSLNRRVPALLDGRDPSVPFLMSNDWPSMSSLGDIASVELVRGPSSALYGTNAFNGVLNLTTKQPRFSQGGTLVALRRRAGDPARRRALGRRGRRRQLSQARRQLHDERRLLPSRATARSSTARALRATAASAVCPTRRCRWRAPTTPSASPTCASTTTSATTS